MTDGLRGLRHGAWIAIVGLSLSACGGGGSGDDDPPDTNTGGGVTISLAQEAETMLDRLDALAPFNTGFTGQPGEMPTSGSAEFAGFAGFDLGGVDLISLTGRATLTADFANRTITGSATDFEAEGNGAVTPYAGTINFVNGSIGRLASVPGSVPNDIRFRYEGRLDAPGSEIVAGADATGKFRGTPIRGLVAASETPATATVLVNGVATPAPFALVAEIQP